MLTVEQKSRIEAATLTVATAERGNGRAFLVAGGYLLTAAHCVDFDFDGGIVLGDYLLQWVETSAGKRFRVSPIMTDPVADIAVLGFPDAQNFSEDCNRFEEFIEETSYIDVEFGNPATDDQMHVFTNLRAWICCKAWMADSAGSSSSVFVSTHDAVTGGISGSAIVNEFGKAVAIMSNFSEPLNDDGSCSDGPQPLIHQSLSKLLHDKIHSKQSENESQWDSNIRELRHTFRFLIEQRYFRTAAMMVAEYLELLFKLEIFEECGLFSNEQKKIAGEVWKQEIAKFRHWFDPGINLETPGENDGTILRLMQELKEKRILGFVTDLADEMDEKHS